MRVDSSLNLLVPINNIITLNITNTIKGPATTHEDQEASF
jgi:hypothetical protein